jgi:hypothetical protein
MPPSALDVLRMRLDIQSKTIGALMRRLDDQDSTIGILRRRIAELEHGRNSAQAAVNAQAAAIEALEGRVTTLAARFYRGNGGYERG